MKNFENYKSIENNQIVCKNIFFLSSYLNQMILFEENLQIPLEENLLSLKNRFQTLNKTFFLNLETFDLCNEASEDDTFYGKIYIWF